MPKGARVEVGEVCTGPTGDCHAIAAGLDVRWMGGMMGGMKCCYIMKLYLVYCNSIKQSCLRPPRPWCKLLYSIIEKCLACGLCVICISFVSCASWLLLYSCLHVFGVIMVIG